MAERPRRGQRSRPMRLLSILQLEAEAPVVRVEAADVREHSGEPGELDARRLGKRLRRDQPSARAAPARSATRSSSEPKRSAAGEPRSSAPMPSGSSTAARRYSGERHLGVLRYRLGRELEAGIRVDPARARPADRASRPGTEGPDAWASRWRSVEPGGPAGSSRSTTPSSAATSTRSAVDSFVTDAQRKIRARSPCASTVDRTAATATLSRRPAVHLTERVHARDTRRRGAPARLVRRHLRADHGLLPRRARGRPRLGRAAPPRSCRTTPTRPPTPTGRRGAASRSSARRSPTWASGSSTSSAREIFATPEADFAGVAKAHGEIFRDIRPVNTTVTIHSLVDPRWLLEIEVDALAG